MNLRPSRVHLLSLVMPLLLSAGAVGCGDDSSSDNSSPEVNDTPDGTSDTGTDTGAFPDAAFDAISDAGHSDADAGSDSPSDSPSSDSDAALDAFPDAIPSDTGSDSFVDAAPTDSGLDASSDSSALADADAGLDALLDSGTDSSSEQDSSIDSSALPDADAGPDVSADSSALPDADAGPDVSADSSVPSDAGTDSFSSVDSSVADADSGLDSTVVSDAADGGDAGASLCQDVEQYHDRYGGTSTCFTYTVSANYDASYCELYLNGFGYGHESHYGIPFNWLEAYISVGTITGTVLNVGMFTHYHDAADAGAAAHTRWSLANLISPAYYQTGFTYLYTGTMGTGSYQYTVDSYAFFVDVRRADNTVVRLWQSHGGQNYTWADAFTLPTTSTQIPYGSVEYANSQATVFDQKRACGH